MALARESEEETDPGSRMGDEERRLGMIFGLIGAVLLVLEGLIELLTGIVLVAIGHGLRALATWEHAFLVIVVGVLVGFFAAYGRSRSGDRAVASGAVLLVVALLGWLAFGIAGGLLGLLGTLLVVIAGLLFLVSGR